MMMPKKDKRKSTKLHIKLKRERKKEVKWKRLHTSTAIACVLDVCVDYMGWDEFSVATIIIPYRN